jgi:adenine deaminase
MTRDLLTHRIKVATGKKKAELVLRNARIVNVHSHEVIEGSLAVDGGVIVGIGAYEGHEEIDMERKYLLPGLIDSHVHIESSFSTPGQFARAVVPHGTTAVITDPHEIANVCGLDGIRFMLDASRGLPMAAFYMLPSCVPATEFENSGAVLDAEKLETLIEDEQVLGLGEVMDYPSVFEAKQGILDKILMAANRGKMIDGHSPMVEGKELNAYSLAGIKSDHESSTLEEMRERLRAGMYCLIRQGSAAQNLPALISGVTGENSRRCLFCTDDRQPEDILKEGHIDNHLRLAVSRGVDPVTAVQMATLNAAEAYGLRDRGALAPGLRADIAVVDDLTSFEVRSVYVGGEKVAEEGKPLFSVPTPDISAVSGTVHVADFKKERLALALPGDIARVIRVNPNSLLTEEVTRKVDRDEQGNFIHHPKLDVLKLAVVERHKATGNIGLALLENYKLQRGAVASTIAHDSHNVIAVGQNDEDIYTAIRELVRAGGGLTMAADGEVLDTFELPIAGLMTDRSLDELHEKLERMYRIAFEELGVSRELDPFMTLSFLALPVIPELKLTDMGLFDTRSFDFTDIAAE